MSAAVSVIVPVHGRPQLTQRCLDLVLAELPADAEVLVVDDASPDETPELLAAYGDAIRSVRLEQNVGFARACNEGADRADAELLVFLNNDVEPIAGWLEALRRYAEANPQAAAVGAKLLYPNGTVQHAGVVFGQDGYPHHLYAGFPADHPAVNRSRPLQAVTGACLLVRRAAFEAAGGFDPGYLNSLEDVDLCLRLGEDGAGEVHYCHEAVLIHLESASRGRSDRFERSVALYRERWREHVRRDDLSLYAADDLLRVEYPPSYPVRFEVDPLLAAVDSGREEKIERLLSSYAGEVVVLLQEVVRLTALHAGSDSAKPLGNGAAAPLEPADHEEFLAKVGEIEEEIRRLQEGEGGSGPGSSDQLGYRARVEAVRAAINRAVPPRSIVLVASRGDRDLIRLDERIGWHFPRTADGRYAGHHPADSEEAVAHLEELRRAGAAFLVFPPDSLWWLSHYGGLKAHLDDRCRRLAGEDVGIFELAPR